jgi:rhodanese-related sulfurtransferase
MKKIIIVFFLATSISLAYSCTSSTSQSEAAIAQEGIITKNVSVNDFQLLIDEKKDHIILDVRTPQEVAEGSIKDSQKLDFYDPEFKAKLDQLDKTKPLLIYCKSGRRSGIVMSTLRELGFKEVYNLQGGILSWTKAGLPLTK